MILAAGGNLRPRRPGQLEGEMIEWATVHAWVFASAKRADCGEGWRGHMRTETASLGQERTQRKRIWLHLGLRQVSQNIDCETPAYGQSLQQSCQFNGLRTSFEEPARPAPNWSYHHPNDSAIVARLITDQHTCWMPLS